MNDRISAGAATLMTSLAGLAHITRMWPAPTGRHRRVPGAVVTQAFRHCPQCAANTSVVVHADGSSHCTDGHTIPAGGAR
ncbi:hypothetical protein [Streptomyces sp. NPDC002573]|uniref:hypothetical protein n=1 Tax=Streptomyces sp. NPDC002573 TaxID=3364651 RepID=UPI00367F68B0